MLRYSFLCAVLFVLCGVIPCTGANEIPSEPVRLVTSDWSPYTSSTMPGHGFFTELVSAVFAEMGLTPSYSFYPWKRCRCNVACGKAWAAFPYTKTAERAAILDFSDSVSSSTTRFFYYGSDKKYFYTSIADLKKYKIGGISGYFYKEIFAEEGIKVFYAPDEKSAFNMLREGRIDLLALNEMVGWHIINMNFEEEKDAFHTLPKALSNNSLRLMVSRSYPGTEILLQRFNEALAKVKANGKIEEILDKYGLLH